jgi:hypothetical protein|tara:strand:- start:148 stop:354 length:207 start_codon:yes stop_codon:yes gene_type:complete
MMIFDYESKKAMKASTGSPLNYIETSMFGPEYVSDGNIVGCNRPHMTGHKREFFATVTMNNDIIEKVE